MAVGPDRVQVLKYESAAKGGNPADDDLGISTEISPQEDVVESAGYYVQDALNRDEAVYVDRSGNDLRFRDANNTTPVTLSSLVSPSSPFPDKAGDLGTWTQIADGTLTAPAGAWYVSIGSSGTPAGVTKLLISHTDADSLYVKTILERIRIGNIIRIVEDLDSTKYAVYRTTGPGIVGGASVKYDVTFLFKSTSFTFSPTGSVNYKFSTAKLGDVQIYADTVSFKLTTVATTNFYTFVQNEGWSSNTYNRSIGPNPITSLTGDDLGWTPPFTTLGGVLKTVGISGKAEGIASSSWGWNIQIYKVACPVSSTAPATVTNIGGSAYVPWFEWTLTPPANPYTAVNTEFAVNDPLISSGSNIDRIVVAFQGKAGTPATDAKVQLTFTYILDN